jgi:hypothetical protein
MDPSLQGNLDGQCAIRRALPLEPINSSNPHNRRHRRDSVTKEFAEYPCLHRLPLAH